MKILRSLYFTLFILVLICCKKPYEPEVITADKGYLVVEGFINTGADSTFIKLSRTVLLSDKVTTRAETGATVTVESESNEVYPLIEKTKGIYAIAPMHLNNDKKYRLRIKTAKNVIYQSDYVESRITPPIDSVNWEAKPDGLQIYSNTHDVSNKSRYYRWEYEETWQFNADFESKYISKNYVTVPRDMVNENIYTCWASNYSSTIVLNSSVKLNDDVIYLNPVTTIPKESMKLSVRYSILVRQYALTKEGFDFWEALKKNTESLGSIFDAQPSQLTGNIRNVADDLEPVLGFISAGTMQQQRIFIDKQDLPSSWKTKRPYDCPQPDTLYIKDMSTDFKVYRQEIYYFPDGYLIPVDAIEAGREIIGHTGASKECTDCTLQGTNRKPAFWQ